MDLENYNQIWDHILAIWYIITVIGKLPINLVLEICESVMTENDLFDSSMIVHRVIDLF